MKIRELGLETESSGRLSEQQLPYKVDTPMPGYHFMRTMDLDNEYNALVPQMDYMTALAHESERIAQKEVELEVSIQTTELMQKYHEGMLKFQNKYLEENPTGIDSDNVDFLANSQNKHNELSQDILSEVSGKRYSSDLLRKTLANEGIRVTRDAFATQHNLIIQEAENSLQNVLITGGNLIDQGASIEQIIDSLQPVIDSIPNTMPRKEALVNNQISNIVSNYAARQINANPDIGEHELTSNSIYSKYLTPNQRSTLHKLADARRVDIVRQLQVEQEQRDINDLADPNNAYWEFVSRSYERGLTNADMVEAKARCSPLAYRKLQNDRINQNAALAEIRGTELLVESERAKHGNYKSLSRENQVLAWSRIIQPSPDGRVALDGKPVQQILGRDINDGNLYQEMTRAAMLFSTKLPGLLDQLDYVITHTKNPKEFNNAISAFRTLHHDNPIVLGAGKPGTDSHAVVNRLLSISQYSAQNMNFKIAQKMNMEFGDRAANVDSSTAKALEKRFNSLNSADNGFAYAGRDLIQDRVFNGQTKFKNLPEPVQSILRDITKEAYIINGGKMEAAVDTAGAILNSVYKTSEVNGSMSSPMLYAPETFVTDYSATTPNALKYSVKRTVGNILNAINSNNKLNSEFISLNGVSLDSLDTDPDTGMNLCRINYASAVEKYWSRSQGHWWLSPDPKKGQYGIFNIKYVQGTSDPTCTVGKLLIDPITKTNIEIDINDLDWTPKESEFASLKKPSIKSINRKLAEQELGSE